MTFRLAQADDRAALVVGDGVHDLAALAGDEALSDPMAALVDPELLHQLTEVAAQRPPTASVSDVTFGPPVPRPQKCFAVGLNYRDHAGESGMELPENPLVFTKFPSCLVGPTADVELRSDGVDYEGELVVVVGRGGKDIAVDDAWSHVVGLTVGQDVSDRPAQFASSPPHFDLGKSFDTFGPSGPAVVSLDSIEDPSDLRVRTEVNGELRQDGTTADLIFDVPTLVSYLSRITTLTTGDLIFTGTPEGVGAASGRFLSDGDTIVTTIDGIGSMTNRCVRVSDWR